MKYRGLKDGLLLNQRKIPLNPPLQRGKGEQKRKVYPKIISKIKSLILFWGCRRLKPEEVLVGFDCLIRQTRLKYKGSLRLFAPEMVVF